VCKHTAVNGPIEKQLTSRLGNDTHIPRSHPKMHLLTSHAISKFYSYTYKTALDSHRDEIICTTTWMQYVFSKDSED
jgi:hypothetical protein